MDYGTLAQLSNPGQTPLTSGIVDPLGYNRWMQMDSMQRNALQKAAPLAELSAQRAQQENTEYMAGVPGRMDKITLGNMNAAADVQDFDPKRANAKLEMAIKNKDLRMQMQDFTKDIAHFGNAFYGSEPAEQDRMIREISQANLKMPDGFVLGSDKDQGYERTRFYLEMAGKANANDPKLANARTIQGMKGDQAIGLANVKGQWAKLTAAERNTAMMDIAKMRADADKAKASNKKLTADQEMFQLARQLSGDDPAGTWALMQSYKAAVKEAQIQSEISLMEKYGIPAPARPSNEPIVNSGGGAAPAKAPEKPVEPKLGSPWSVGKDANGNIINKKVTGIGRKDGKIVKIRLEDGTEIDYK